MTRWQHGKYCRRKHKGKKDQAAQPDDERQQHEITKKRHGDPLSGVETGNASSDSTKCN
jgi:hypothetical protein